MKEADKVRRAQLADMADASLTFEASIAPLDSAIQVSSHGGARVKIDIPESEMPAIVRLVLMRGKTLKITIEDSLTNANGTAKRKSKQSAWAPAEE